MEWDKQISLQGKPVTNPDLLPLSEHSFADWQDYVQWHYQHRNGQMLIHSPYHFTSLLWPILEVAEEWSAVHRDLYSIYAYVFVLCELNHLYLRAQFQEIPNVYPHNVQHILHACEGNLAVLVKEMDRLEWTEDSLIWDVMGYVSRQFIESGSEPMTPSYLSLAYQRVWMMLAQHGPAEQVEFYLQQELVTVRELYDTWKKAGIPVSEGFVGALLCLHLLQGQDEEALQLLSDQPGLSVSMSMELSVQVMQETEDWERRIHFIRAISPHLEGIRYHREILRNYAEMWIDIATEFPEWQAECYAFLTNHLPMTSGYLETLLLRLEKYQTWVELQLLRQLDPLYVSAATFKPVEKANRALLLPIYHQAVERYVRNKNRDSYKRAARLLVKLASHYKKLKQVPVWEEFMSQFLVRHSRLRSLHEELRRKGLIS
jgi:hypothetical protein